MDGQESNPPPPLLSPLNAPFLFPTSLPSSSLHPPLQTQNILPDIDWVSLLSGHENKLMIESGSNNLMSENGADHHQDAKGANMDKRKGSRIKKTSRPRFAFQTRSEDDILDDGYRWRKYGQKA
ncbi:hypothetical protein Goari_013573, partial [Gossypium aridum]|nr:hypothetical protein [Gossypium aridum]